MLNFCSQQGIASSSVLAVFAIAIFRFPLIHASVESEASENDIDQVVKRFYKNDLEESVFADTLPLDEDLASQKRRSDSGRQSFPMPTNPGTMQILAKIQAQGNTISPGDAAELSAQREEDQSKVQRAQVLSESNLPDYIHTNEQNQPQVVRSQLPSSILRSQFAAYPGNYDAELLQQQALESSRIRGIQNSLMYNPYGFNGGIQRYGNIGNGFNGGIQGYGNLGSGYGGGFQRYGNLGYGFSGGFQRYGNLGATPAVLGYGYGHESMNPVALRQLLLSQVGGFSWFGRNTFTG